MNPSDIRAAVQDTYGRAARRVLEGARASCCGSGEGRAGTCDTGALYEIGQLSGVPDRSVLASLGCGNPTALAGLRPGETVLDLGSGGGLDVLLSAQRVGPTGRAYGLDMTPRMHELADESRRESGLGNVEFLQGVIEEIPLPDESVDVILSNCVINLSTDKNRVLGEAFRVLRPGGRLAVSDMVSTGPLPEATRQDALRWAGCVAGALDRDDYLGRLRQAGFVEASVEFGPGAAGPVSSAFVRALKPACTTVDRE